MISHDDIMEEIKNSRGITSLLVKLASVCKELELVLHYKDSTSDSYHSKKARFYKKLAKVLFKWAEKSPTDWL